MKKAIVIISMFFIIFQVDCIVYAEKHALVIGNANYKNDPLDTPVNDADAMASVLKSLGFSVEKGTDLTQQEMENEIRSFRNRLRTGDTALFYYSGHGVEVDGINYLIPIEIPIDMIRYKAVPANMVIDKMEEAGSKVNIVILDACRSNLKGGKGFGKGLAAMQGGEGTYIAYATAPGTEAYTGTGSTSIFTKHLVNNIKTEGLKIEDMFKRVRKAVMDETSKDQKPWDSSMLVGDFYFAAGRSEVPVYSVKPELKPEQTVSRKYTLRSKPIEVSYKDFTKIFRLDDDWKPLEYIENNYQDNGDGTITDHATGLTWQKSGSDNDMSYSDALKYIENLNQKPFAGYNDWRIPTIEELKSLLEKEKNSDGFYIDPIFDKNQSFCWSLDTCASGGAWHVNFDDGGVYWHIDDTYYVRAVRP